IYTPILVVYILFKKAKSRIREEEKNVENNEPIDKGVGEPNKSDEEEPPKEVDIKNKVERKADDEPAKSTEENVTKNKKDVPSGASSSQAVGNRVGKTKRKTYNILPRRPVHDAILKKKITRKEDIGGNFEIPCSVGRLKNMNALVDQESDVNVMSFSMYNKLIDERHAETDIRLSLASHSYIYPLGIVEDILVDVVGYVYPVDFLILNIKEDEKGPAY
nr:hypothetical protein [Tanacetum cinerariifolium]